MGVWVFGIGRVRAMAYIRYYRAGVRRLRLRLKLRRSTVEFSVGLVPERLGLGLQAKITDPDWDPFERPKTFYTRFRVRSGKISGAKESSLAPEGLKRGAAV